MNLSKTLFFAFLLLAAAVPAMSQDNWALHFDGDDDHVEVPFASNHFLFVDFTIELKVFMTGGDGGRLISQVDYVVDALGDEAYSIHVDADGYIYFDTMALDMPLSPHTAVSDTPPTMGQWNHIAARFVNLDYSKAIYLNGVQVFWATGVGDVAFDNKPLYFGGRKTSGGNIYDTFAGRLDEIRMWAVARTDQEILDNMDLELTGSETGLRGYWNFNEGAGSIAGDSSSYGIDGAIVGATWSDVLLPVDHETWSGVKALYH